MDPDMMVFWLVVLSRLLLPLTIPRYPLPGVIACLILDGIDQTIFQQFTSLNLDGYQGYDKALDIYYLVIAYISTLRNWTNHFAFKASRFLLYYRLIGVVLFELTHLRPILLIFPNTFEYFFIFYEIVALRWNPVRMSKKLILAAVAFIWIFIKLPQEYWLHIAQMDATEFLNKQLLGEPADAPIVQSFLKHPEVLLPILAVVTGLVVFTWWFVTKKLPAKDWSLSFRSDDHMGDSENVALKNSMLVVGKVLSWSLVEKVVLVSLVSMIFAQILPGVKATYLQLIVGVGFVVLLNTVVSHWLSQKGVGWASMFKEFVIMMGINFGLTVFYVILLPRYSGSLNMPNILFFVFLLTLMVTLFDRYLPVYQARFGESKK